ncbi:beta-lactamase family protein [Flavobacteriaceae bacterium TP-CH-4]|uniref:Beta-lactamase family protein n=1 Tax=Pelagihabitans pacificus TaxID=2696054 RepID=A0A967AS92_9FLAO|nr:serine hydrolase domain-containing protein [Pelagihabitans pacificus]NHF59169.1 beta-lactamase family protein [Pelagihabitans pacificus]
MKRVLNILGILILALPAFGQYSISKEKRKKIDSLLRQYDGNRPGYALGIVQNGALVHSKGYGKANLDYNIPITDSTAFYIGSMAKQFTAAALLILESEGKLDFKKSIKEYLPDFTTYNYEVTIEHLIHHTSGVRETNSLQLFQGIDGNFEEVFSTDDLYGLIKAQKELNFKPGSEHRYSSGGYAVLAKIIEKISGQSLRAFLEERVFEPLGMKDTFVCDNHNEVVPNRAVSYWPVDNGRFERRVQVFDAYGDGGIITTVEDLLKWDEAFYKDVLGVKNFAAKMYQKGILNNGSEIDYARALNVWEHKGQKVVQHNGGMLGFRVDMVRFPKQGTTIILLGNSAFLNPTGDALKIAEIILEGVFENETLDDNVVQENTQNINIPESISKERAGYYWTDQMNYYRRISFQNDSLFLDSGNYAQKQYLRPISQNEYLLHCSHGQTRLLFGTNDDQAPLAIYFGSTRRTFRKFDAAAPKNIQELAKYVGVYKSEELQTTYTFFKQQNKLFLGVNNKRPMQVYPAEPNSTVVWNGNEMLWIGFGEIKFDIDERRIVKGFAIGDQRVSGVSFEREKNNQLN